MPRKTTMSAARIEKGRVAVWKSRQEMDGATGKYPERLVGPLEV